MVGRVLSPLSLPAVARVGSVVFAELWIVMALLACGWGKKEVRVRVRKKTAREQRIAS